MNKSNSGNIKRNESLDKIAIGVSLLLLIAVFVIEVLVPDTQTNSTAKILIEAWKVASSLSIAWFTQKYLSRIAYFGNLKDRALGAYRRISDIKKSVDMLDSEVGKTAASLEKTDKSYFRGIQFGIELIKVTVLSSMADWTDVIGEDLAKKDKLNDLQQIERSIETNVLDNGELNKARKLEEIREEINRVKQTLPHLLRFENIGLENDFPRGGRVSPVIMQYFLKSIMEKSAIYLTVESRGVDKNDFSDLKNREPFVVVEDVAAGNSYLVVHDSSGEWIGEVINPFDEVYKRDFIASLEQALSIYGIPGPSFDSFDVPAIARADFFEKSPDQPDQFVIRIPVNTDGKNH